jgi:AAA15 family ATPase/GTPase
MFKSLQIIDFRLFKNQTILLGKQLTVISGRNSTGKSTILGMLANSGELKKKDGTTYFGKAFKSDFSEIFKGSKQFDSIGGNKFVITLSDDSGNNTDFRSFRTAWQQTDKARRNILNESSNENLKAKRIESKLIRNRFRIIPHRTVNGKKIEAKFDYPILYLGLSRLFPLGEAINESITTKEILFKNTDHRDWFILNYKQILSMHLDIQSVTNCNIGETDKKNGIGVNTGSYDYLTNSSGQDTLGQILLALLSFKRLKESKGDSWGGGLLLIDEVDSALHPAAQRRLMQLLIQEARLNKIQIIFTTHSSILLKDLCNKIEHNDNNESVNNNIELHYLTNANRQLEIKRNIPFIQIENDLLVSSIVQSPIRIKIYSEDSEARWILKSLISDYLSYVELLDTSIGCDALISMYNADISYFGNTLIVFDGDVTDSQLDKIPQKTRDNFGNIIKLPGNSQRPEQLLYQYLLDLDADHSFWSGGAANISFTWDYFKENGPMSDRYTALKEREKYKKWFNEHRQFFESINLMAFWINDNQGVAQEFINSFLSAYNLIARRTAAVVTL